MRYERKYKLDSLHPSAFEQAIRLHPASFRPIYSPRQVNNLYFDTPDFIAFHDNAAGVSQRVKHRLRWYGRPFEVINDPVLETKVKDNLLGRKESFPLPPGQYRADKLDGLLGQVRQHLGYGLELQPVLFNSYHRSYWTTPNGRFRITVDSELQFGAYREQEGRLLPYSLPAVILELKYEQEEEEESDFILQHLPFRQTKSSKYGMGVEVCYGGVL
ncbi:MAG: polyphosphate polymerase domain-containing protein [Lewinellaceae bacterium]|nr:polyphosphate polymerase domain-containing protein [Phaeodactylibacter sp.]MCB9040809.1 polyphosphate polymerase domain-containing protein [Lewinellaceae bacterium]